MAEQIPAGTNTSSNSEIPSTSNSLVEQTDKRQKLLESQEGGDYSISVVEKAFKCRIITYQVNGSTVLDPKLYLAEAKQKVFDIINTELEIHKQIKVNLELCCTHVLMKDDTATREFKYFNSKNAVILKWTDISLIFEDSISKIITRCEEFQERNSGWSMEKIEYLSVNINKCNLLKAGSYIDLPRWIKLKKACVNVQNKDDNCFFWSIVSALHPPAKNSHLVASYPPFEKVLKTDGIPCPVTTKGIKRFETLNKISINVYGIEANEKITVLLISQQNYDRHINLLYHEKDNNAHYCWIKNLSRLVSNQISKNEKQKFICESCLQHFTSNKKRDTHVSLGCGKVVVELPNNDNNNLKFTNIQNQLAVPFVIYADFECMLQPMECNSEKNDRFIQKHVPYSFAYYLHCNYDDSLSKLVTYRGEDCVVKFIDNLYADASQIGKKLTKVVPITENIHEYPRNSHCHICEQPLLPDHKATLDHCHLTGTVRGYTHDSCNINYKMAKYVPVFFHNLSGYDSHIFIKELSSRKLGKLQCIAKNKENYISFSQNIVMEGESEVTIRFLDSYKFMASSLDKLAKNLSDDQFTLLNRYFSNGEQMALVKRKGVFPYEYIDSWLKLDEKSLPDKDKFKNSITQSEISDESYDHARKVWTTFGIKTMGEYSDLYLKTDVLLLVEVFEAFRKVCLKVYKLDPCRYYTAPSLSWDAMLKITGVNLKLLTDYEMLQFFQAGIRGGVSQVSKRHVKANNAFMEEYDPTLESSFVVYLDKNNLYGNAMSKYLPLGEFKWLSEGEIEAFNVQQQRADSETGYVLEVDLDYPQSLHDLHNDYPFCAEKKTPPRNKIDKLLLTLQPKTHYVIHYMNLKQCVEQGLVCNKIHRVLSFKQSPWLKPYIDFNTKMRISSSNSFEKDFYKLMNNSIFGKTIENVAKRVDVHLLTTWSEPESKAKVKYGAERYIMRPNFHSRKIFNENFVAIQMNKTKVKYDKPLYVGFCVLELSKHEMYDFHYGYMLPKYNKDVSLLYTDTDSFIYEIRTENFYEDIKPDLPNTFDTSDFLEDNVYRLPLLNKKLLGFMKDESNGKIITEFVGLRSKMYAYKFQDDVTVKKNKGTPAATVRALMIQHYKQALDRVYTQYETVYSIGSDCHNIYTQKKRRKVLSSDDDKRYVCHDNINTLAWGHYRIKDNEN